MTNTEQNQSSIQSSVGASAYKPRRRYWLRLLLTAVVVLVVAGTVGRQLTKPRWHTLYSHPQPGDKLMLAVECPPGWEEDTSQMVSLQNENTIWIHPKPTVGLLHWWQEHILRQEFTDHTIILSLMEEDLPASKEMNEMMTSTMKSVDPSPRTTLTRHRLGPQIDMRLGMAPMPGQPANASPTTIVTMIYPDETPTKKAVILSVISSEFGQLDRDAEHIRKEIIRRARIVKR